MLKRRIEKIINDDGRDRPFSMESFLTRLSAGYGAVSNIRANWYRQGVLKTRKLPCPVISIGNLTAGGTGKTPMTIKTAEWLARMGLKVVVISRGYKGRAEKRGGIVSDGRNLLMGPESAGDEPFMMAAALETVPVLVGADRYRSGMRAVSRFQPDVIVLDDAFQHLRLHRDINLVLLDSAKPLGNRRLLPRGPLREPLDGLLRADALVLTRWEAHHASWPDALSDGGINAPCAKIADRLRRLPVFKARHEPSIRRVVEGREKGDAAARRFAGDHFDHNRNPVEWLRGRRIHAFSGIARNDDFRSAIEKLSGAPVSSQAFADHHSYTDDELRMLLCEAQKSGADLIATTEKDYVRIAHRIHWPIDLAVIGIEMTLGSDEHAFAEFIRGRLQAASPV